MSNNSDTVAIEARNLARNEDGSVIHRADCRYARHPWHWADRVTDDELLDAKLRNGYRICKVCKPSFRRGASRG